MLVSNLDQMEKIVAGRGDLAWNGWDVVQYSKAHNAQYSVNGAFRDGEWMKKKVFPLTERGWNLPNNLGRADAQVER